MFVGHLKIMAIAAIVLVVGLSIWGALRYVQQAEENKRLLEVIQGEQDTRERVKDAIKDSPDNRNDAIEFLLKRQGRD